MGDMTNDVKEIFRAMMPAFNNANKSVITPLLATGHQVSDNEYPGCVCFVCGKCTDTRKLKI